MRIPTWIAVISFLLLTYAWAASLGATSIWAVVGFYVAATAWALTWLIVLLLYRFLVPRKGGAG
jgi:hypothetical protein